MRDRIPEIIVLSGKRPVYSVLADEACLVMVDDKLNEELTEYQESKSMEELADLLEIIRAVAAARGSSIEAVETIRRDKAAKRGGFGKKILLSEVIEDEQRWPMSSRKHMVIADLKIGLPFCLEICLCPLARNH